jgi:hypothetical protein
MPPVAEAEHDGRLFAAMPMGIAVNRPDSTIVFSSISANATSTVFSVNGGPWTPGTTATLTGCAPITAVTSFTIRTMRIRVTNPAGSSERQWRIACGTNPVIGSPPTASTDVIGSLPWFRGDSLFANSTSTDPEGGLATTQWQVREAPDASEWVNLSLTDTAVSFLATGNTLQLSYFGGTTPNLRMVPGTHFPQGFELRLLVVDADEQIDTTAAISAPYLGNRAPTASLVRSPSGGVRTLTNVTFTAVCTDPEGDTPFTYAWSPTNRTSGDGGVSAIYRMDDNGVTVVDMTCTDLYGASASASLSLTWNNRGPNRGSFSVSPASPFALGETITITASGYSDPDGTVTEWQWELREPDNILRTLSNGTPSINWTLLSGMDGNVLIRYRARDDDGAWSGWSGNSTYIMGDPNATPINNGITSPVANGFNVSIGSLDVFSGACTDLDGDPLTYRWRVNGVTVDSSSVPSYNHTWNTNGAATITFDCWDGRDWSAAATRTGTVNNAAPTATLLVPADGFYALPSSSLAVSASGTDPDGHAITSYRWYVNGSLVSTTATSTTTLTMPAGNGAVTIGVSVGDPYGLWSTIVTVNGIVTNIVGPGSIVAAQDAVLAGNSMTFTASGFAGATSYSWLVNGAAAGTGTSISPVLTEGLYTIEVSATNGLDTQTATLSNYCALGIPATQAPAQPYDDTNNSAGQTWWTLTGGSKRPRWTNPVCHDATISVVVRTRVGAGAWGAYTPYGTTTGNNYTHPGNLSAREPVGIGAPNRFYQFAIILTAGSGAASTGPVEDPSWVTIP